MTELRVDINTHTPKALVKQNPKSDRSDGAIQEETLPTLSEPSVRDLTPNGAKRRIIFGHPALTRKDFILAWSLDIAAFRTRQKQSSLDRRAAKRASKEMESDVGDDVQSVPQLEAEMKMPAPVDHEACSTPAAQPGATSTETSDDGSAVADGFDVSSTRDKVSESQTRTNAPETHHDPKTTAVPGASLTKPTARRRVGPDGLSLQHVSDDTQIVS